MNTEINTHPRYHEGMRTNIDIDDELMARALRLSKNKTKKDVVHEALEMYVKRRSLKEVLEEIRGKIPDEAWDPDVIADLEAHRAWKS